MRNAEFWGMVTIEGKRMSCSTFLEADKRM